MMFAGKTSGRLGNGANTGGEKSSERGQRIASAGLKYGIGKSGSMPANLKANTPANLKANVHDTERSLISKGFVINKKNFGGHDVGSYNYFKAEQAHAREIGKVMGGLNWMGRAIRPSTSGYLNSKKNRLNNESTQTAIQAKGYSRVPKGKKIFTQRKPIDPEIFAQSTMDKFEEHFKTNPVKKNSIGLLGSRPAFRPEKMYEKPIPRSIMKSCDKSGAMRSQILNFTQTKPDQLVKHRPYTANYAPQPSNMDGTAVWSPEQRDNLVEFDKEKGDEFTRYLTQLKNGERLIQEFQDIKATIYFHRLRMEKLKPTVPVISYESTLRILTEMYPRMNYLRKNNPELRDLFLKVNGMELPPDPNLDDLKKKVLDINTPIEEKKRLAEY